MAHVSIGHPVCRRLARVLAEAGHALRISTVAGGTYVVMEGPQFSTMAESNLHRSWHADVIGMTNMPEAKLAREAELCYATVAMVTDFDVWHPDHDHVDVQQVVRVMQTNSANAKALLRAVIPTVGTQSTECEFGCDRALEHAIMTSPGAINPELAMQLDAVAGRVLRRRT